MQVLRELALAASGCYAVASVMRTRSLSAKPLLTVAALVLGCHSVVGIEDRYYAPSDAKTPTESPAAPLLPPPNDSGACRDTTNDSKHCGRCGHDCLGGACVGGRCQPVALQQDTSARAIAVDAHHVYWTEPNRARIVQADKSGDNQVLLYVDTPRAYMPTWLVSDETHVYWTAVDGAVMRCKIGGCNNEPDVLVDARHEAVDIAVNGPYLYWIEDVTNPSSGYLKRKLVSGGETETLASFPVKEVNRLTVDADSVYVGGEGALYRVPKTGGSPVKITSTLDGLGRMIADDQQLYWTNFAERGALYAVSKADPKAPFVLVGGLSLPMGIAFDQNNLFWTSVGPGYGLGRDGSIMMCPFTSCATPVVLADRQASPLTIAVDEQAVYWANFDAGNTGGGIMKVARP